MQLHLLHFLYAGPLIVYIKDIPSGHCSISLKGTSCYSRHNLCVVDQVLQRVAAGEVIVEVCGVADQPLVGSGCVNEPGDDRCLDT